MQIALPEQKKTGGKRSAIWICFLVAFLCLCGNLEAGDKPPTVPGCSDCVITRVETDYKSEANPVTTRSLPPSSRKPRPRQY